MKREPEMAEASASTILPLPSCPQPLPLQMKKNPAILHLKPKKRKRFSLSSAPKSFPKNYSLNQLRPYMFFSLLYLPLPFPSRSCRGKHTTPLPMAAFCAPRTTRRKNANAKMEETTRYVSRQKGRKVGILIGLLKLAILQKGSTNKPLALASNSTCLVVLVPSGRF